MKFSLMIQVQCNTYGQKKSLILNYNFSFPQLMKNGIILT